MINRIILLLTLSASAVIASEPDHMMLDENTAQSHNHEIIAHNTRLLHIAMRRADVLHGQLSTSQLINKFVQQNGTTSFSAREANRNAGQEIVDQILDKNLPAQQIKRSSKKAKVKQYIARIAKL